MNKQIAENPKSLCYFLIGITRNAGSKNHRLKRNRNATDAIPQPTTGSRTEAAQSASSRNSTKYGLFAQRDFILEGEDEEYSQTFAALMAELSPEGIIETTFATEIMGARWRLRRCRILEFGLARPQAVEDAPQQSAVQQSAVQQSIDRARAQSHNIIRRSLAELRKLQTERHTRILASPGGELSHGLGMTDSLHVVKTATEAAEAKRAALAAEFEERCRARDLDIEEFLAAEGSFCKKPQAAPAPAPETPRNALCPCGSGVKYKRCCGTNAPPLLNTAA